MDSPFSREFITWFGRMRDQNAIHGQILILILILILSGCEWPPLCENPLKLTMKINSRSRNCWAYFKARNKRKHAVICKTLNILSEWQKKKTAKIHYTEINCEINQENPWFLREKNTPPLIKSKKSGLLKRAIFDDMVYSCILRRLEGQKCL
jgi:hypothetical protein